MLDVAVDCPNGWALLSCGRLIVPLLLLLVRLKGDPRWWSPLRWLSFIEEKTIASGVAPLVTIFTCRYLGFVACLLGDSTLYRSVTCSSTFIAFHASGLWCLWSLLRLHGCFESPAVLHVVARYSTISAFFWSRYCLKLVHGSFYSLVV